MQIQSKEVIFFAEVSKFSSFSEAADMMNIPQPTVSRRILSLEEKINAKLFLRSKSGVVLSEFGEQFLSGSLEVKHQLNALKKLVNREQTNSKHIIIEALQPISTLLMNGFISYFREMYPEYVVELKTLKNDDQDKQLEDVIRLQGQKVGTEGNKVIHFLQAKRNFYVSPRLWLEPSKIEHPIDIQCSTIPFIGIQKPNQLVGNWRYFFEGEYQNFHVTPSLIVDDAIKARDAVINELGISWNVDVLMNEAVLSGEAIELLDPVFATREDAYITYSTHKELSEAEQCFIKALRSYYLA